MLLRVVFLLFFYLLFFNSSAQLKIDSLKSALSEIEAENGRVYTQLGFEFLNLNKKDSAIFYYKKALSINLQEENDKYSAANSNDLGVLFFKMAVYDSSIIYYSSAFDLYSRLQDTIRMALTELNIGMAYKNLGKYEKAIEYLLRSAEKLERQAQMSILSSCYNTLGNVYHKIGEYTKALFYHKKSLNINLKINNQNKISHSYNNLGNVYSSFNQLDSALFFYQNSLKIKEETGLTGVGITLGNIGGILDRQKKYAEAEKFYDKALEIARKENDPYHKLTALNNLASNMLHQKKYNEAKQYLNQAAVLADKLKALGEKKENIRLQLEYYSAIGDNKNAILKLDEYDRVKDTLFSTEKAQTLAEMEVKYETNKKQHEIELLQRERELQQAEIQLRQTWINGLVIGSILLTIIGILIFWNSRITKRNKEKVELLLRELQHRVKNNLQIISSLLSLQSQQLTDVHAVEALKSGENRVNAMAMIHRRLYSSEKVSDLNIRDYISEIVQYLVQTYGHNLEHLKTTIDVEDIDIDVDKAIPIGLIVNELVSNAFKYGLKYPNEPILTIKLKIFNEDNIFLLVTDNGPGLPNDLNIDTSKSLGLKIVKMLIGDLNGELEIDSREGTSYYIKIPVRYGKSKSTYS